MSIFTYMSPGVYLQEEDLTIRVRIASGPVFAGVSEFRRGPMDPTYNTSGERYIKRYGKADPSVSRAHDCFLAALTEAPGWIKRVDNGSLYGGIDYIQDSTSKIVTTPTPDTTRILTVPFPVGLDWSYKEGARDLDILTFDADLVALNQFDMSISDGTTTVAITPVTYASSHNSTMSAIATAITTAMAGFGTGGVAQVYQETSGNNYVIILHAPLDTTLTYLTPVVTLGASQAGADIDGTARLFSVFQENPGAWGDKIGVKMTAVDTGIKQRFRITFGGALVASNSFVISVNGTPITPEVFDTDSDTTMANIAAALEATAAIESAEVITVPGAVDNDRAILVIAAQALDGYLTLTDASVTLGASQASVIVQETLKGVAPSGEFTFEVYEKPNVRIAAERFRVSLAKQVNANGTQTAIDLRINKTTNGSSRIRIVFPETSRTKTIVPHLYESVWTVDETIKWLDGGADGSAVLNSQVASAWDVFKNRIKIPARILVNGGYTDPTVQQKMVALAEYRWDAIAVLDMPQDSQATEAAYEYRMQEINIDSSYGALYTPDLLIQDDDSDEERWIPPSGHVTAAYGYTQRTAKLWYAPAGLKRGKVKGVRGLYVDYEHGDRELLVPVGVNTIINKPAAGPTIWGEETLQYQKSILSSVHARILLNMIEVSYADGLDYTVFDPNNAFTRDTVVQMGNQLLEPIKREGGLIDYFVLCDERNNTPDVIDEDGLLVYVYLKITPAAKRILLKSILTPTGASFSETIARTTNRNVSIQ